MRCPKCQFDHPLQTTECLKCGIIFSKYKLPAGLSDISDPSESLAKKSDAAAPAKSVDDKTTAVASPLVASRETALAGDTGQSGAIRKGAATEFKCRLLALPLALLMARGLTLTGFDLVAGMLAMVVHECGHAIAAWLAGRWAIPTFWFTMMGQSRSWFIVLLVTGAILFGGFQAWRAQRWGWFCAAAAMLLLQISILSASAPGAVVIFAGDGGAMVLATILMAMFYAPRDSVLSKSWGLRWGLLVVGTLAFMHVYRLWSGSWANIPFGEIEGRGPSDPTLLTEMYGWSVLQLVDRYLLLANACFVAMGAMYVGGLISAYLGMHSPASRRTYNGSEAEGLPASLTAPTVRAKAKSYSAY